MAALIDHNISSWILSKSLSVAYFIAFLSLIPQVLGLFGRQGILSIDHLLNILDKELKAERFYHLPSVFWFFSADFALKAVCFAGLMASSLAFMGFSQSFMLAICFVCYLSFVSCGQIFLNYQWDTLLLELGFLGLFFAPFKWEWLPFGAYILHPVVYGLVLLLVFKLIFLSGVSKLTTKDLTWRNLTALTYHYWTQPLPTPLAYFVHKLPPAIHKLSAIIMFVIELIVPFLIFVPGPTQTLAVILLVGLQILIMLTGNYGFFNLLTAALCLSVLPDSTWGAQINWLQPASLPMPIAIALLFLLVPSSLFWLFKGLFEKSTKLDFLLPFMRFFYPFRISNPYGLFAVMTKNRPELILEGSHDGITWLEYKFKYKPTSIKKYPSLVAPHLPRLDWQLWFAGLENFNDNLWLQNLMTRLFEQSQDVTMLFEENPFKKAPPEYLRFLRYEYKFASVTSLKDKGEWWSRELIGPYSPTFKKDDLLA